MIWSYIALSLFTRSDLILTWNMQLQNLFLHLHLLQLSFKSHRIIRFSCLFVYFSEKYINKCLIYILNSLKSVEFVFIDLFPPCWVFSYLIVIIFYSVERFSARADGLNLFKLELYFVQTQNEFALVSLCMLCFYWLWNPLEFVYNCGIIKSRQSDPTLIWNINVNRWERFIGHCYH